MHYNILFSASASSKARSVLRRLPDVLQNDSRLRELRGQGECGRGRGEAAAHEQSAGQHGEHGLGVKLGDRVQLELYRGEQDPGPATQGPQGHLRHRDGPSHRCPDLCVQSCMWLVNADSTFNISVLINVFTAAFP